MVRATPRPMHLVREEKDDVLALEMALASGLATCMQCGLGLAKRKCMPLKAGCSSSSDSVVNALMQCTLVRLRAAPPLLLLQSGHFRGSGGAGLSSS